MATPTDSPPSTSQPSTPSSTVINRVEEFKRFKHYTALTLLVASPIIIALPPRKLDFYTISLGAVFLISANHLTTVRTGRSITANIFQPSFIQPLPSEKAQAVHAQMRAAREAQIRDAAITGLSEEEVEKLKKRQQPGVVERVWMGGETEGWKEKRLREEQEALDEGKGYADLIVDHIWDVWTWGKKDGEEGGESQKTDEGR
ncbi:hypothetical protein AJ80_09876 [Polytolypa hystricis UAMH7299]|uniref:Uncharacterized protein n=1 Tax=Polytolypa hystricis (strain UAMH7299) TaxID=1447883 RepID=A0A2B7WHL4_POLH7|nr:hypothetical protein AJ80_09876 [Polytolypa hystricis UAMH7299]